MKAALRFAIHPERPRACSPRTAPPGQIPIVTKMGHSGVLVRVPKQ